MVALSHQFKRTKMKQMLQGFISSLATSRTTSQLITSCITSLAIIHRLVIIVLLIVPFFYASSIQQQQQSDQASSHASSTLHPRWSPCGNGSLSVEFRTSHASGQLVYAEDARVRSALQLKLVMGEMRLRWLLIETDVTLSAGQSLDDGQWHRIEIRLDDVTSRLLFTVDKTIVIQAVKASFFLETNIVQFPLFYIGTPTMSPAPIILSSLWEPQFAGDVGRILLSNCGVRPFPLDPLISSKSNKQKTACGQTGSQCLNGGVCIRASHSGERCDCTATRFSGPYCNQGKNFIGPPRSKQLTNL